MVCSVWSAVCGLRSAACGLRSAVCKCHTPVVRYPWAGHIHQDLCSVTTSSRDDPLFCVKRRGFLDLPSPRVPKSSCHDISSNWPAEFACLHIKIISDCVAVSGRFSLTAEKIASYPSYSETQELLKALVIPVGHHDAWKVTGKTYMV